MTTFEGKVSGRRLRVSVERDEVTVEALNGHQSGSTFHFALTELKKKPDLVIDSATRLRTWALLLAIVAGFIGVLSALHWGQGVTKQAVVVCAVLVVPAAITLKVAPRRRVFVWSTKTGAQAFAFEDTPKNRDVLNEFLATLSSLIERAQ